MTRPLKFIYRITKILIPFLKAKTKAFLLQKIKCGYTAMYMGIVAWVKSILMLPDPTLCTALNKDS